MSGDALLITLSCDQAHACGDRQIFRLNLMG